MGIADYLVIYSLIIIWITIFMNVVLIISGYIYYEKISKEQIDEELKDYPFVSILVPAHNEAIVIRKTVMSLLELDYPKEKYEVIIINDNSSDNSAQLLEGMQRNYEKRNLIVINTDNIIGGKGKSNALNIGLEKSKGEILAVYDADNTPDRKSLKYLVQTLIKDKKLGAVIGKFRCRNKDINLLTNFINIETLTYQWMAQAGRWNLFKLCTIPGTNFVVRREIMNKMGGWDTKAITEDTEVSFRIYRMGYKIKFMPLAVTYEQEPQTVKVWFKQRNRWAKGNIYVVIKNLKYLFDSKASTTRFDILYYTLVYFFFLSASVISDCIFLLCTVDLIQLHIGGYEVILWIMALLVFVLSVMVAISTEKGELNFKNVLIILLSYFTYCKMWSIVSVAGFYNYIRDIVFKREVKWYKTERFS
ncbi:glycosyltransferase [Clostridium saccharobutylicum]|uniref:Beta-monoglucosyldiacylglycerol synthase n=1 Tax=Clostridium saccharobutylicum DSM 13864 TaxID=1345695 RepID=U5MR55_CLOSA|nr:glycosyltransferase family 2 protein [Clostridium saccharobutylicum]AGX43085.1 glycosyltransferase YdaM [Clostridium saccharobutylicum DSM 13864]AQR90380.1 poly-beta-1,6-N-acetyl-D-glucosamine synthase [Clostridium saccharobutylicum]AQS00286.1 poly-beta-1,6-N-acetyl-D-glucosamine synthase [Clostridium saccharobutylicum]AQS14269.1 poly-beta-1,6-N-acetyl-D-glucosamine synthase [Clostridium saccharobutylicum]MBA8898285.1 cellulose synthase/poly-beta-1,6-N-acetylglucosamine synthase-like glycos